MQKTTKRKYKALTLLLLLFLSVQAQNRPLSSQAQISLLTVAPSDDEVYTVYGHSALRIQDPANKIDHVFNYGLFSFSKPNFIYRFAKGETDYQLGVSHFNDFLLEYEMRGSQVTEQILALDSMEKAQVWNALLLNYRPENREYRYNFFFDNCATRPAAIIEKQLHGEITFPQQEKAQSFRDMINYCTRNHPWLTFGCDLALGSPTDQLITAREEMFLPLYLKEAFSQAKVTRTDGTQKNLVESERILAEEMIDDSDIESSFWTPMVCCWLFFLLIVSITYIEWSRQK